ncbi:MAG: glycosyl hydrolase family 8 [Candidatus Kaistia colombiensis]|nr:MAG: glycosyl hydrolase family 8 [Kaistia sp.]
MIVSFLRSAGVAALVAGGMASAAIPAQAEPLTMRGTVSAADWRAYSDRFVAPTGRVIDDGNGGISHSEGQGYGLLLAFAADDRAGFERIWSFTRTELMLRDDGLAVWSWQPTAPHVRDTNNASDGDLLIAYALAEAGWAWSEPAYLKAATAIATMLGKKTVVDDRNRVLMLPGVDGFSRAVRPDGPVVNLSYWIFEALPVMAQLAPATNWQGLAKSGLSLLRQAQFGAEHLPTDWISVEGKQVEPAAGFDPVFGYNAVRIPLYIMRAGISDAALLAPYEKAWLGPGKPGPAVINVKTNAIESPLDEPGYRILAAALACVRDGTPVPADLKTFAPTLYYPSTLHLLSLSFLAERRAECL